MSKQITTQELAAIVARMLVDPESVGILGEYAQFQKFMTDIAQVVCNHAGGEVCGPADDWAGEWLIAIAGDASVPEGGGVWADYDKEGQLFNDAEEDKALLNECNVELADSLIPLADAIEVHGVRNVAGEGGVTIVEIDDVCPESFSVYLHRKEGGVDCVGDHETLFLAQKFANDLAQKYGLNIFDSVVTDETIAAWLYDERRLLGVECYEAWFSQLPQSAKDDLRKEYAARLGCGRQHTHSVGNAS